MKIAICQLNSIAGDIDGNLQRMKDTVSNPKFAKASYFVFPELFITGYQLHYLLNLSWFVKNSEKAVADLAKFSRNYPKTTIVFGNIKKNIIINNGNISFSETKTPIFIDDFFIDVSVSPFYAGKYKDREKFVSSFAKKHNSPFIAVNSIGASDEFIFEGGSIFADKNGIIRNLKFFEEEIRIIDTETENLPEKNNEFSDEIVQIYSALKLGVKDYFAKCGFKQAVLGLSGGIDSSVTAAIAVDALGKENVFGIMLPSRFSSNGSIEDAEKLAKNLGISCETVSIENSFITLCEAVSPIFKGTEFNLAEENMQSRIRGVILMAVSNKFNRLLLSTGNKSEASVGYCTLYGDTNGALAVIADVYKTDVYRLAQYINRDGEIIPVNSITKAPSAELRHGQKDEDSLPPYPVLDKILKLLLEEGKSCDEIVELGEKREVVEWIFRAIKNSEYKRKQATTILKVSKRALGADIRFPLAARF